MQPSTRPSDASSLRDRLRAADPAAGALHGAKARTSFGEIVNGSLLGGRLEALNGKSVLVLTQDQHATALSLIEIDGVARRLVLCPPDVARDHLPMVIAAAEIDMIVADGDVPFDVGLPILHCRLPLETADLGVRAGYPTQWVLMTSATTGAPKLVAHDLASLTAAIQPIGSGERVVWGTFYDIRRYGGLQILLRAILTGGSMVLSAAGEPTSAFLRRLGTCGLTHVSGTPTHWRRALMSGAAHLIAPRYIRLSGEIADQPILDGLRSFFPDAAIGHAFASTEAGLAFDVDDGREGFPASLMDHRDGGVELRLESGSLRVRSTRVAAGYLGTEEKLAAADGFVDTGDMLERRGARYHFVGRRSGTINVGGLKVHPEEVEGVINLHRSVRMSLVKARRSPITGALVVADVVLKERALAANDTDRDKALKEEILHICRDALSPHKVPATIRFVPSLTVAASGKLARPHA